MTKIIKAKAKKTVSKQAAPAPKKMRILQAEAIVNELVERVKKQSIDLDLLKLKYRNDMMSVFNLIEEYKNKSFMPGLFPHRVENIKTFIINKINEAENI